MNSVTIMVPVTITVEVKPPVTVQVQTAACPMSADLSKGTSPPVVRWDGKLGMYVQDD